MKTQDISSVSLLKKTFRRIVHLLYFLPDNVFAIRLILAMHLFWRGKIVKCPSCTNIEIMIKETHPSFLRCCFIFIVSCSSLDNNQYSLKPSSISVSKVTALVLYCYVL